MHTAPPDYECHLQEVYEAVLGSGDFAVDVGAHLGRHAIPMARRVFPSGRVFAFEPLPACRSALDRKVAGLFPELAAVLEVSADALGEEDGSAEFVVARDAPGYSGLRERPYDGPTRLERIQVRVRRMDDLFLGLPSLRFVKVDAEGGELHILRGARGCLGKFRPVVAFECGARALAGYGDRPADVAALWASLGYHVYAIDGELLTAGDFVRRATEESTWDYFAVPAEDALLAELVRARLVWAWRMGPALRGLAACEALNEAGMAMPPLSHRRGPGRLLAGAAAWFVLRLSRFLLRRQQEINTQLLRTVRHLTGELSRAEERIAELERRLGDEGRRRSAA